eukprot:5722288-Pyramimonas_sp.AAC.1
MGSSSLSSQLLRDGTGLGDGLGRFLPRLGSSSEPSGRKASLKGRVAGAMALNIEGGRQGTPGKRAKEAGHQGNE